MHGEGEVDIHRVLKQFLNQQPVFSCGLDTGPFLGIDGLSDCLAWCMEALRRNTTVSPGICGTVGSPAVEAHTVLCTLWHLWMGRRLPASPSSDFSTGLPDIDPSRVWEAKANPQFGISATELLSTVVYMIMAAVPKQDKHPNETVLDRALAGAHALDALSPEDLIHRFLDQVRATHWQPMALPAEEQESHPQTSGINAEAIGPFRSFAAKSLGIHDLPMLEQEAVVFPIVLADPGWSTS
jgi:hypothetical protein